ncbi:hypothetical protein DKY63_15920 [Pseudomonas putida]|uniref:Uncharacterized protein n=1 Tax=Pseudomonas putida TaxID=303 RepID=A0A2Z4RJJ5_PSEPU|nr:hypothetical protein [Pseudomonas putida]AWY41292.1 hypothetical protein DKY63_15920 [Pseudomonas putida]
MSTDRQKSFIATIGTEFGLLHFLDEMYGERAISRPTRASGGSFTGRPQSRDDSHLLGLRKDVPTNHRPRLTLYFRHTNSGYQLYIRTPGPYFGMCLSTNDNGLVGAFPSDKSSDTFYLIRENGIPINLENLNDTTPCIYLQSRNAGVLHTFIARGSPYTYIATKDGTALAFNLNTLERNAPYLNHPSEV